MEPPETRYAKCGDAHVAYQVFGEGPRSLVWAPGFVSHIENHWEEPSFDRWRNHLGQFCRVIKFDKRGTGLPDRVSDLPSMDKRMEDLRAVTDAAGMERASVSGISEGGPLATGRRAKPWETNAGATCWTPTTPRGSSSAVSATPRGLEAAARALSVASRSMVRSPVCSTLSPSMITAKSAGAKTAAPMHPGK